jgi:lipoyl(octanoyl) transferase
VKPGRVCWLETMAYGEAYALQQRLHEARVQGEIPDTLLLLEHPPVITLGKGWHPDNLLFSEAEYARRGIEVYPTDRGGDVTYHAPGQLIGYPIFNLCEHERDLHRYLRNVEEALICTLQDFGLEGRREPQYTGVWVGNEKVAAIGVKASHWVTMHGFALNVNTDLNPFRWIIPCGIQEKGVTSMQQLLGRLLPMEKVIRVVTEQFSEVFQLQLTPSPHV